MSPYTPFPTQDNKKKYSGYSATTPDATHKWMCSCGATISVSPCPFCGKEFITVASSEEEFKKMLENDIRDQNLPADTLDFYGKYLDCIYNPQAQNIMQSLEYIYANCGRYFNGNNLRLMLDVCDKKLVSLGYKRCKGCGKFSASDAESCSCGYKF